MSSTAPSTRPTDRDMTRCAQDTTTGYVHSIETAGTVDGPGVRFVVFLSGCPLSCAYCHNPDCQKMKVGEKKTAADVLEEIAHYKSWMNHTHGGVTISGGEPLVQPEFTEALLKGCKEMGIHTALDTSGYLNTGTPDSLIEAADLILLDIKSGIPDLYKKVAGVPLQPTLDFAQRLTALKKPVWVRFVLVPGLTDGEDNIRAVADIVAKMPTVERLEVLPFHKMGEHKWDSLGKAYSLKDTQPPTPEQTESTRALFRQAGIPHVY